MQVLMVAAGTTGDLAPYIGLAARFSESGHDVAFATFDRYADRIVESGFAFRSLQVDADGASVDIDRLMGWGEERELEVRPGQLVRADPRRAASDLKELANIIRGVAEALGLAVGQGADVVLLPGTLEPLGWPVVEGLGVPSVGAYVVPMHPTRDFPFAAVFSGVGSLGPWGNRAATRALLTAVDGGISPLVKRACTRLGLPRESPRALRRRLERRRWPVCYGFSPAVVPRPADWRAGLDVVGYWWPPHRPSWRPTPELVEFLQAGPPPVLVSFGSTGGAAAERLIEIVAAALRQAGMRGVIQSGWAGLSVVDDDMITVGEVSHEWLMPRTAAVVHHAGAGTTAAGLRAGIPAVPLPVCWDQEFWARRLVALGVSPGRLSYRDLNPDDLAEAIRQAVSDSSYRAAAAAIATQIHTEDGAGRVIETINHYAASRPGPTF